MGTLRLFRLVERGVGGPRRTRSEAFDMLEEERCRGTLVIIRKGSDWRWRSCSGGGKGDDWHDETSDESSRRPAAVSRVELSEGECCAKLYS
jgi:hypothetical protein